MLRVCNIQLHLPHKWPKCAYTFHTWSIWVWFQDHGGSNDLNATGLRDFGDDYGDSRLVADVRFPHVVPEFCLSWCNSYRYIYRYIYIYPYVCIYIYRDNIWIYTYWWYAPTNLNLIWAGYLQLRTCVTHLKALIPCFISWPYAGF